MSIPLTVPLIDGHKAKHNSNLNYTDFQSKEFVWGPHKKRNNEGNVFGIQEKPIQNSPQENPI